MSEIVIHTDGASRGNPGAAAIAYVIEGLTQNVIEFAETIGVTTNNQAEYRALVAALEALEVAQPKGRIIRCFADSELMVKQLNGEYRVKDTLLRPHFERIRASVASLEEAGNALEFNAVLRTQNKQADALANVALDSA